MKKVFNLLIVMSLLLALPIVAIAHTEGNPFVTDLIADGGDTSTAIDIGDVLVWNDGDYLYIKYLVTNSNWCLTETHLQVATSIDYIPQAKGNPIPGKFDLKRVHECDTETTYQIPLTWDANTELIVAAHAKVKGVIDTYEGQPVFQYESAWSGDYFGEPLVFTGKNWAFYFMYSVQQGGVVFSPGQDNTILTQLISNSGGTIEINDGGPLDGIKVHFPAGALPGNSEVLIGYNNGNLIPNAGSYSGITISLNVSNVKKFKQPVVITVPFNNPDAVPIPYYINGNGQLRPAQLLNIDRVNGFFSFQIFHASLFTWIVDLLTPEPETVALHVGFVPNEDGFQVINNGSLYNRDGECFGMTSFSLWYFMDIRGIDGDFYPRFYNTLGQDSGGNPLRGQDVIATRSFISISQQWNVYSPIVSRELNRSSDEARFEVICNIIENTMNPVLIYLSTAAPNDDLAHSVLAYSFDKQSGEVEIYDPDFPGVERTIQYDVNNEQFNNYSVFDQVSYNGDGSLNLTEPYQNILVDAEDNFNRSTMPIIDVTSHPDGSTVTSHNITLSGNIQSVEVLVSRLIVYVGSVGFTTDVPLSGNFSIPLSLESGINHLTFSLEGEDVHGNLIPVTPTNLDTVDFTIELTQPNSMILMTLTWDKDDTDLDTYVIDPTGDYSCYYHMLTADGGELDYDVIFGFGPEHWTLMNTDIVRYDQPYRFRVHYYSDHGNGGTNYLVTIKLYEGTSREVTYSYTGYLSANVPSNNHPLGTGPDWVDIAELTLTQEATGTSSLLFTPLASSNEEAGFETVITVPVPSVEERLLMKRQP